MTRPAVRGDAQDRISIERAARLLGISRGAVLRLGATPRECGGTLLDLCERRGNSITEITFSSLVRFCSEIRARFDLGELRPMPASPDQCADGQMLPFFPDDILSLTQAVRVMGSGDAASIFSLIRRGKIEAYRITADDPWRISRSSLEAYIRARG